MLKQAFALWKNEKRRKGTTLQRRLVLFFASATICLVLTFALLLLLFGITGKEAQTVQAYFDNELLHISDAIYNDFGALSVTGIDLAATISDSCDNFFAAYGINADGLAARPELIEPLLSEQLQTLLSTMNSHSCSGVFLLLDATVRPTAEHAAYSKSGFFLKKTHPFSTPSVGAKNYCLRGPAQPAREYGIELMGQWRMEYDITDEAFFSDVMQTARENEELPLSRLYCWTNRVTLKDNSEAGFLLCVPLRSADGIVFGICGLEVSDRLFKQQYCPSEVTYENVFTIAAPCQKDLLCASQGMIAGNYYLTSNRIDENLICTVGKDGFTRFSGVHSTYGGKLASLRLYPAESPYASQSWSIAIAMPEDLLENAVKGSFYWLIAIICILLLLSLAVSVLISRHYLRPVTQALDSIRNKNYDAAQDTEYLEIADLFDFLAEKDQAHEEERRALEQQRLNAQADADSAQTALSRLSDQKRKEIDPELYELFLANLITLTPREREIFNLYLDGLSGKEIVALLNFSANALKFHNKNIYDKLGVSSRKELLLYATLMNHQQK